MKNSRKNKQFQLSLKNRITAIVLATIMLLQILIPGIAAAAQVISDSYVAQAMVNPLYREVSNNSYLYEKADFADAVNLQHQSLETFHAKLKDAKFGLGKPSMVPIAGDITIFVPYHKLDKLIGDQYVQSRFIRQQIFNQLGRHISDPIAFATELDQINSLYNNAYTFANENRQYLFGNRLPAELTITRDMVWPEKRNINGQDVIAPIVYLTPATLQKWSVSDHKIEFFGNSATFKSVVLDHQSLNLGRDTWLNTVKGFSSFNGSVVSEGNLQLNIGGIFQNIGGSVAAANAVNIVAGQIHNKTLVHSFTDKYGQGTRLGQVAGIQGSNILLRSKNDIIFEGSTATATNGTITMQAGGNISIQPVFTQYQAKTRDGHWQVTSSSLDVIGSKISATDTIKLIADGAITISASELVSTEGGIELLASQGIHVLDELTQEQIQKIDRKGRTTGQSSEFRTEAVRAVLSAGKGVLLDTEFGDVTLKASKINSTDGAQVYARNGTVHLLMTKELEEKHLQTVRKGTWTIKTRTEDIVHENNLQNTIIGGLQVQAMYGINLEYTGKEGATLAEQVEEFRRMPGMEWAAQLYDQNATAVNWQVMEEVHKELKKTKRNLSPAAMAIIAICVAVAMGPAGASLVGPGGTLSTVAGSSTLGAAVSAGAVTLTTQAVQSLAAGNNLRETLNAMDSNESLRSLAISMVTAGALEYANAEIDLFKVDANTPISPLTIAKQAGQAVVDATITAAVSVSVNGGNSEEYLNAFKTSLASSAVNVIGQKMSSKIGDLAESGNINEAVKYIAHAGLGCAVGVASAKASGIESDYGDQCVSGSGGAVVGEYVGNLYAERLAKDLEVWSESFLTTSLTEAQIEFQKNIFIARGVDMSKLMAAFAAYFTGGEVNTAALTAVNAAKYNSLQHKKIYKWQDENGIWHFSDVEMHGEKPVPLGLPQEALDARAKSLQEQLDCVMGRKLDCPIEPLYTGDPEIDALLKAAYPEDYTSEGQQHLKNVLAEFNKIGVKVGETGGVICDVNGICGAIVEFKEISNGKEVTVVTVLLLLPLGKYVVDKSADVLSWIKSLFKSSPERKNDLTDQQYNMLDELGANRYPIPRNQKYIHEGGPLKNATQVSGNFKLEGGIPNSTVFRADGGGNVTSYLVYDENGMAIKRVDITGAAHRGVPTPHVVEYGRSVLPDGTVRVNSNTKDAPRPATWEEIP